MKYQIWLDSTQFASINFEDIKGPSGAALSQFFQPTYDITYKTPFPLPKTAYVSVVAFSLGTEVCKYTGGSTGITTQEKINLASYTAYNCFGALTFNLNVNSKDVHISEDPEDTWGHTGDEDLQGPLSAPFGTVAPRATRLTPVGVAVTWKSVSQNTAQLNYPDTNPPTFISSSIFASICLNTLIEVQPVRQLVNFENQNELRLILTTPQKYQNQNDGSAPIAFPVNEVGKTVYFNLDIPHCVYPGFTETSGLDTTAYLPFDNSYKVCVEIETLDQIERPLKTTKWLWINSERTLREGRLAILAKDQQTPNYQGYASSPIMELYRRPTFDLFYRFPYQLSGLYKVSVKCFNLGYQVKQVGEDQKLKNSCYEPEPMFNSLYVNSNFSSAYTGRTENPDPVFKETFDTSLFSVPIEPLEPESTYNLTSIGRVGVGGFAGNPVKYATNKQVNGFGTTPPIQQTDVYSGQLSGVPSSPQTNLQSKPKVFNLTPSQNQLHIVLTCNEFLQLKDQSPEVFENWQLPYYYVNQYMPSDAHPTPNSPTDNFFLPFDSQYQACLEFEPC